jgi:hypothetical protein
MKFETQWHSNCMKFETQLIYQLKHILVKYFLFF